MLVLTRKAGDAIVIGENGEIVITVLCVKGSQIKIGVEAPQDLAVNREEIWQRILAAKQEAVSDKVVEAA